MPPLAVNTVLGVVHVNAKLPVMLAVGNALTIITALPLKPVPTLGVASLTDTNVYVVVEIGDTGIAEPVIYPLTVT